MDNFTFALPSGYDWDVKKFAKQVKTITWCKQYRDKLHPCRDRLTNAGCDNVQVIGGMLQTAFGVNIGRQVESLLKPADFDKIAHNIINNA